MDSLISVIIPVYNAENSLQKCVESIKQQTYKNIEIILIDDASSDNSWGVIQQIRSNEKDMSIICKKLQINTGSGEARNEGLNISTGEYIFFLDADDMILPQTLEKMLESYNNDISLVMCGFFRSRGGKRETTEFDISPGVLTVDQLYARLMDEIPLNWFTCIGTKLYKKSVIDKYHIRFSDRFFFNEDLGFIIDYIKCLRNERISVLKDDYYCYTYTVGSVQHKKNYRENSLKTVFYARSQLREQLEQYGLWETKKIVFADSMVDTLFSLVLCDWDNYDSFCGIVNDANLYKDYLETAKNNRVAIRIFQKIVLSENWKLVFIYLKIMRRFQEWKRRND